MTGVCRWCRTATSELIAVGIIESMSGPGWTIWACPACKVQRRILPMSEWTTDSPDGRPQYATTGSTQ